MGLLTGNDGRSVRESSGWVAVLALVAAGCGTESGQGAATTSGAAAPSAVDVSALDVGNYPTKLEPALGAVGRARGGVERSAHWTG